MLDSVFLDVSIPGSGAFSVPGCPGRESENERWTTDSCAGLTGDE